MEFLTILEEAKIEEEHRLHARRMDFAAKADRLSRYLYDTKTKWIEHK